MKTRRSEDRETKAMDEREQGMGEQQQTDEAAPSTGKKQQKTSKEVYFSVLPDKYEPLIEEVEEEKEETTEERRKRKEEKKRKKKQKYKKYRKVRTDCKVKNYCNKIIRLSITDNVIATLRHTRNKLMNTFKTQLLQNKLTCNTNNTK